MIAGLAPTLVATSVVNPTQQLQASSSRPPVPEALVEASRHLRSGEPFLVQVHYTDDLESVVLVSPVRVSKQSKGHPAKPWRVRCQRGASSPPVLLKGDASRAVAALSHLFEYSAVQPPFLARFERIEGVLLLSVRSVPNRPEGSRTYVVRRSGPPVPGNRRSFKEAKE